MAPGASWDGRLHGDASSGPAKAGAHAAIKYRPEVDGLRAIAVTSVLISHAEFMWNGQPLLKGGFIGVDIFFVISGYLISSIILSGLAKGSFSFADFYERRARRILPPLLVVLACTLPVACMVMLPDALKDYAGSLVSALLSFSNVWFWLGDDYFADPSALKPLLHTWSLGIEEQFYFIFPTVMLLLWRVARHHLLMVFVALTLVSLAIAHYGSAAFPVANFFLLPSRAWELSAGAILAKLALDRDRPTGRGFALLMPALGLAMILGSIAWFDDNVRHPSLITLVPVAGTMLIIWFAQPREAVTRLLASPPFVGIGLISYSLYLWHFPLFALSRISSEDGTLSNTTSLLLLLASAMLAVLSYYLIEKPTRSRQRLRFRTVGAGIAVVAVILVGVSSYLYLVGGVLPGKPSTNPLVAHIVQGPLRAVIAQDGTSCHSRDIDKLCHFTSDTDAATVLGVGDSFIDAEGLALKDAINARGWGYIHDSQSGCPWIPGMIEVVRSEKDVLLKRCNEILDARSAFLAGQPKKKPTYVVYQMANYHVDKAANGDIIFPNGDSFAGAIHKTLALLEQEGFRVVLVYPMPAAKAHVPRQLLAVLKNKARQSAAEYQKAYDDLQIPYATAVEQTSALRKIYDDYASPTILRVDPFNTFCSKREGICRTHDEKHLFYADSAHLSYFGASMLTARIVQAIAADIAARPAVTN